MPEILKKVYKIIYIYFEEPERTYSQILEASDPDSAIRKFVEVNPRADIRLIEIIK